MSEPRTAAGRMLLLDADELIDSVTMRALGLNTYITAIEAEAAAIERQRLGPLPRRQRGFSPMVDGIDYDSSDQ